MLKLQGKDVYLAALEREDCKKLYSDFEYDFDAKTEMLNIGYSIEGSDKWFEEIQAAQGNTHVRLGVFLNNGEVIGDIALQDIDWKNRTASLGMGFAKLEHRSKGYGKQALGLIVDYSFNQLGLERLTASTLEHNRPAQKSLEKFGFTLEGKERQAVYFGGKRFDRYNYGLLSSDLHTKPSPR